jgi:hypothetical protein
VRPLPIPHLHDWRKIEVCLIYFYKGKDDEGVFKFLQYSVMECNCARKFNEGLFRKYSTLRRHKCEDLIKVLKYDTPWPEAP